MVSSQLKKNKQRTDYVIPCWERLSPRLSLPITLCNLDAEPCECDFGTLQVCLPRENCFFCLNTLGPSFITEWVTRNSTRFLPIDRTSNQISCHHESQRWYSSRYEMQRCSFVIQLVIDWSETDHIINSLIACVLLCYSGTWRMLVDFTPIISRKANLFGFFDTARILAAGGQKSNWISSDSFVSEGGAICYKESTCSILFLNRIV